jgi:hypothetical protein
MRAAVRQVTRAALPTMPTYITSVPLVAERTTAERITGGRNGGKR